MALVKLWKLLDSQSADKRNATPSSPFGSSNRFLCDMVPDRGKDSLCNE
jgi:hypothetical protein